MSNNSLSPNDAATMANAAYLIRHASVGNAQAATGDLNAGRDDIQLGSVRIEGRTGGRILSQPSGMGFCATSSDGKVGYIVLRGTNSIADAVTDVRGVPCSTGFGTTSSMGFVCAFKSFEPRINDFLNANSFTTIHCIGHSLGGALASITANKLIMQNPNVNIKLYTFGCPRVFSKGHNVMTNVESYRVFHKCDPVSMLGPFPYTHGNLGINVGDSNVMRPSHHSMDNYISKCSSGKAWNNLAIATDNHYIEDGLSWMFRQLQKFLMYAVTISAGGAIIGALNIADALYALMQTGMKISKAIASLIRQMAKYVYNGWESAKAKASQSYYETKPIMLHIIDLFLQKVRQVASQAIDLGNRIAGAGVDATRRILPIIGQNVAMSMGMPVPVIFYL